MVPERKKVFPSPEKGTLYIVSFVFPRFFQLLCNSDWKILCWFEGSVVTCTVGRKLPIMYLRGKLNGQDKKYAVMFF